MFHPIKSWSENFVVTLNVYFQIIFRLNYLNDL